MARQEKPIDWALVDKLIMAQNNASEIASHFNIDSSTFYRRVKDKWEVNFENYALTKYSEGRSNLRLKQFQKAMEGNTTLLLKLGEFYLEDQKPTALELKPSKDEINAAQDKVMTLEHQIQELKAKLDDGCNQPKTE